MNNTTMTTSYSVEQPLYATNAGPSSAISPSSSSVQPVVSAAASFATNDHLERVKKSQLILEKYPDRVPLIIEPSKGDRVSYPIDKSKYITPRDLTLLQLQQIIRKRIHFPSEKALFMFINNRLFPITSMVGQIYDDNKDSDGFLYVTYCQENTFGSNYK